MQKRIIQKSLIAFMLAAVLMIAAAATAFAAETTPDSTSGTPETTTLAQPTLTSAAAADYQSITLNWTKVEGAEGYYVYCADTMAEIKDASVTSYTFTGVTPNQPMNLKVRAYAQGGAVVSADSNVVQATAVFAAPVMKSAETVDYKRMAFSWEAVPGAAGYEMFINGRSIGTTTGTSYTYKTNTKGVTLTWGSTYKITVRAYCTVNGQTVYSGQSQNPASAVMRPEAPATVKVKPAAYNTIKISWSKVKSAAGYKIYRKAENGKYKKIGTTNAKTLTFADEKATLGVNYTYCVRAYWKTGSKVQDGAVDKTGKTTQSKLNKPKSIRAKANKTSIKVAWKQVPGAQGYIVYRRTAKGKFKKIAVVKGGSTVSYLDAKVKMNETYVYTVKAYRKVGSKVYKSDCNKDTKAVKFKITSKIKKVKDKNSVLYGKKVKLYYYPDGSQVQDLTDLIKKPKSYLICVNRTRNQVTVYTKKSGVYIPLKSFICSVGASGTATPTGTFYTKYKYRWQEMMGPSWGQWVTRITWDGILFHSVFYNEPYDNNKLSVTQYNRLGRPASHGCIRMTAGDAKWLYDNCPVGTKVVIYTKNGYEPLKKPSAYKLPSWHTWDPTDPNMAYKCRQKGCHNVY